MAKKFKGNFATSFFLAPSIRRFLYFISYILH
jgi:hypothetical protein